MKGLREVLFKYEFEGIKGEEQKGYFHEWVTIQSGYDGYFDTKVYALIETLSGNMLYATPENIQFTYHDEAYRID